MLGQLDDDVVGVRAGVVGVAVQALQAGRAGGEDLHGRLARQARDAAFDFLLLAEAHLGGDVGTRHGQRAGLAAAAVAEVDAVAEQLRRHLRAVVHAHRIVAGLVVEVAHPFHAVEPDALLHQVLVDVEQAAAGEDLVEFVLLQLVHAGAAGDDHRANVEVVERVGEAMEQHAIVGDDLAPLVGLPGCGLRVAAAQVARRQHGLRAQLEEHRLGGQADLREQPFRAAAGEVEHRIPIVILLIDFPRIADHRHDAGVLDIEQCAAGALGQFARHRPVDEVDDLGLQGRAAQRGGGRARRGLRQPEGPGQAVAEALRLVAPFDHALAQQLDGGRVGDGEKPHGRPLHRAGPALAFFAQEVAHGHRHVAVVDVHRARLHAAVADGAVVGDVVELVEMGQGDAAPRLLLVEEGFHEQAGAEDLVARAVEQVGARHVRRADRLALAAAQAVLDAGGNVADAGLLEDERLDAEQAEAGRVGIAQVGAGQQLAAVEAPLGVDALFVRDKRGDLLGGEVVQLGDADAVLAGDDAAEAARQRHDAVDRGVGLLQHGVVVGVHRNVGVHVAVAGVHVQGDEDAAAQDLAVDVLDARQHRPEEHAVEDVLQLRLQLALPGDAHGIVLQGVEDRSPLTPALSPEGERGCCSLSLDGRGLG